jgi:small-conductance mechanosensitive channel
VADVDKLEIPVRNVLFTLAAYVIHDKLTEEEMALALHKKVPECSLMGDISQIRELISFWKIFYSLIILFITYFINKFFTVIIDNLSERATNYRLFIKRLVPVSRILIWSFAIYIVIAGIIVPPFETVITIAASVGIAVLFPIPIQVHSTARL